MVYMEYTVNQGAKFATVKGTQVQWTSIAFATVFKSKERAQKVAKKHGGEVELYWGRDALSNKSAVAGKKSPINGKTPYRTI